MAGDQIRYDLLVQEALRGVVRKVLASAARDGLPGDHYFHIEFLTPAAGVRLSDRMRERFPERMTIILQHTFWNLEVSEEAMEVGLSFGGVEERVRVPFAAITGFFDESVQFGLRFEVEDAPKLREPAPAVVGDKAAAKTPKESGAKPAEPVVARTRAKSAGEAPAKDATGKAARDVGKDAPAKDAPAKDAPAKQSAEPPAEGAKVLSIDAFRKKS